MLDLAHPRQVLPLAPLASPRPDAASSRSRQAIQLKLSEHVLSELVALARNGSPGGMRLDLSSPTPLITFASPSPALPEQSFIINGVSYPLNLAPEPPHTELVRQNPATRALEPVASVTHKASFKPGGANKADLEKAGQHARTHREQAEKEREGRRAVLLDSAPNSRASSHTRSPSLNGGRNLSPAGTGSRNPSPAAPFHRPPSRLSAVPPKPTASTSSAKLPVPVKPPTSSFRIGKGAVPASMSRSSSKDKKEQEDNRKAGTSPSGGESPENGGVSTGPAPSPSTSVSTPPSPAIPLITTKPDDVDAPLSAPPPPAPSTAASAKSPEAVSPARQDSASSSSNDSTDSLLKSSTSTRTSLSSAGSPGALEAIAEALVPEVKKQQPRGGIMKGKETLKREKKKEERSKSKVLSKATIDTSDEEEGEIESAPRVEPPAPRKPASSPPTTTKSAIPTITRSPVAPTPALPPKRTSDVYDDEASTSSSAAKKKRKLLNNLGGDDDDSHRGRSSSASRAGSQEVSRAPTPRGASMAKSQSEASAASGTSKKRGRTTEAWYSSSEDESESLPTARPKPVIIKRDKKARTSSVGAGGSDIEVRGRSLMGAAALHLQNQKGAAGSPLRASSVAEEPSKSASPSLVPSAAKSLYFIDSRTTYERRKKDFMEAYTPYSELHARLMREKEVMVSGQGREEFEVDEVEKLVKRLEKQREALEGIRLAIEEYLSK
ncbi:hypothetical protein MNV49_002013 [Pseudohyphozyma bogoriensis]|nr:hypothetical protein MNV49_002013 [Pseudohyphozyma bogoriensis]